jgi:2'-5' RNA ligase
MPSLRLFIAIDPAPEVREELAVCARRLRRPLEGVRWVAPEAIHVTLWFLGETDADCLDGLAGAVGAALTGQAPFGCEVGGLGVFPDLRRPAVLWAGVPRGGEALVALAERLRRPLEAVGLPLETRPFAAHITLGRFRRGARVNPSVLQALLQNWREHRFGRFTVDQVTLYASVLEPAGPQYEAVRRWPLPVVPASGIPPRPARD